MTLMLGLAVVLAGCSAVQPSTSMPAPSIPKGAANVEPDEDRQKDGTPLSSGPARPQPDRSGRHVVEIALKHVGTLYRWGGASPDGFDCSGFVRYVYSRVGVSLPHNAAKQYRYGTPVPRDELQPGDLVFFDRLRHNGIYIGAGKFIHARQTGKRVSVARLDDEWYDTHWVGARRL
jgi:cell wall-associated NlpC family hydrolase